MTRTDLLAKIAELQEELKTTDRLLAERNRVLAEIPPCPAHGEQCVPHCIEWVAAARDLMEVPPATTATHDDGYR